MTSAPWWSAPTASRSSWSAPSYFNYKDMWTGGHDVMGATSLENTFYFAEGYTGADVFEEWLTMLNPGPPRHQRPHHLHVLRRQYPNQDVDIGATSRLNVFVNEAVGLDREVSVKIEADDPIMAERPIYFNYKDMWTGGHDVIGSRNLGGTFYFAEGYTGADVFEEWLTIQNPGSVDAHLRSPTCSPTATLYTQDMNVGPTSRATVNVNEVVGTDREVSVKIQSDQPILAERPMYFNYKGEWTGGARRHRGDGRRFRFLLRRGHLPPRLRPLISPSEPGSDHSDRDHHLHEG